MAHYHMIKKDRKRTPPRKDDVYALIIEQLAEPKTAHQIAEALNLCNGSIFSMLTRLLNQDAISREKVSKSYVYTRKVTHITASEVYQFKGFAIQKKEPTISGARVVTFDNEDMQDKLKELNRLYSKDKRRTAGKVYVSGQTLEMVA